MINPTSQETRDLYDDYMSSCIEKERKWLPYLEWVAAHWQRNSLVAEPLDLDDNLPF